MSEQAPTAEVKEPTFREKLDAGGEIGMRRQQELEAKKAGHTPEVPAEQEKAGVGLDGEPLASGDQLKLYQEVAAAKAENPDTSVRERAAGWGLDFKQRYEMTNSDMRALETEAERELGRIEAKHAADERKAEGAAREATYQAERAEIVKNNQLYESLYQAALRSLPEAQPTSDDALNRHYEQQQLEDARRKEAKRIAEEALGNFKNLVGETKAEKSDKNQTTEGAEEVSEAADVAEPESQDKQEDKAAQAQEIAEQTAKEVKQLEDMPAEEKDTAAAAKLVADIEGELQRLNEMYPDDTMPESVRETIEKTIEEIKDIERQIQEALDKAQQNQTETEDTEDVDQTEDTEAEEQEPFRLRLRDRLSMAGKMLMGGDVRGSINLLFKRGEYAEEDAGPETRRKRIIKWAIGAAAVAAGGALVYANRDRLADLVGGLDFSGGNDGNMASRPVEHLGDVGSVDTGGAEDVLNPNTLPAVEALPQVNVPRGGGWFEVFGQLGVDREHYNELLTEVGPKLQEMGVAYEPSAVDKPTVGSYGINRPGRLPESAIRTILNSAESHGYMR